MERSQFLEVAEKMIGEGVDVLDVGGYSSRPGAEHISEEEERERAIPAIEALKKTFPEVLISVDTFRASIAEEAVGKGADMVNDISAGELDPSMMERVAALGVPYMMMHMPGTPQDMQERTDYEDLTGELIHYLSQRLQKARSMGILDPIIDPGFGFGKTAEQNYRLLRDLRSFSGLGVPLLVGLSRKSMIWRKLGVDPSEALNGTTVLHSLALQRGADILRVHDVREASELIRILKFDQHAGRFK